MNPSPRAVLLAGALIGWLPAAAGAQVLQTVDYVFPEASTRNGDPDPATWPSSGNLAPELSVRGLRIADPDGSASLLYFHQAAAIGAPRTRTIFRVAYTWDPDGDVPAAWSSDIVGVQILLDDGQKRVALGFGRDPVTMDRQVIVLGAADVAPIRFAWDNQFPNIFEISRLPTGDFAVSIFAGDPRAVEPPIVRAIPAAQLPPSSGPPRVGFGFGAAGGGIAFWTEAHARIERAVLPFSSLATGAQIGLSPNLAGDRLSVGAQFQLGDGNDGIDPLTEDIRLDVGTSSWLIPAGSFNRADLGAFIFQGMIGVARLDALIRPLPDNGFFFGVEVDNAGLEGATNPIPITLIIGNDGVTTQLIAWLLP